jgi:hypothetical protein
MKRKWTKEKCVKEAKNFVKRGEFLEKFPGAYHYAKRNGFIEEICRHMKQNKKNISLNKTQCRDVVKGYSSYTLLRKEQESLVCYIRRKGWEDLFDGLERDRREKIKWNKKTCKEVALTFNTRIDFFKNYNCAYEYARKNNILEEICSHMSLTEGWMLEGYTEKEVFQPFVKSFFDKFFPYIKYEFNPRILTKKRYRFPDCYVKDLNLVIEFDEPYHKSRKEMDVLRENEIKESLGCRIIRIEERKFINKNQVNEGYFIDKFWGCFGENYVC